MINKDDMQIKIEEMARNAALGIIAFTDQIAKEREEKERIKIEAIKRYAYEKAYENKYGSLNYIKHL